MDVNLKDGDTTILADTEDETFGLIGPGVSVGGLDRRQMFWLLTGRGMNASSAEDFIQAVELERALKRGDDLAVYNIATDWPLSEPVAPARALAMLAAILRAKGDDGSIRVTPWNDSLPGWVPADDPEFGTEARKALRLKRCPETRGL